MKDGYQVHLLVYVDDLIISESNEHMTDELKGVLKQHFKLKNLRKLKYFLRFEIARPTSRIVV